MPTTFKILMTGLDEVERILEAMSQEERRATFILKKQADHPAEYNNPFFKFMVDYTILLTKQERQESYAHVWGAANAKQRDLLRNEVHVA